MVKGIGVLLGAAMLAAAAGPAAAQIVSQLGGYDAPAPLADLPFVPAPEWREGSEWRYSDGYHIRVTSTNGLLTVFERLDAEGEWFSRFGFLRQDSVGPDGVRQTIYRTISPFQGVELSREQPLVFRREYLKNGELMVHATSWTVEGQEEITTPAGTFKCWIIVWRSRSLDSAWTGFERWWYAPAANNYVRMEYKYGDMPPQSRVLMRYRLSDSPAGPEGQAVEQPTAEQVADDDGLLWTASLVPHPVEVYPLPPLDGALVRAASIDADVEAN